MANYLYVPVIKAKRNDLVAISRLSADTKAIIKPLVELLPVPEEKTVDDHMDKFAHNLAKYGNSTRLFVDLYGFLPNDRTSDDSIATIAGFRLLRQKGLVFTPAYGFSRDDTVWTPLAKEVARMNQGFCFRVDIDDLVEGGIEETWEQVIERSAQLGVTRSQTDLLLDLRYVGDSNVNQLKELVLDFLSETPGAGKYRSVIVSSSSALKNVTSVPKDGVGEIPRKELRLWMELQVDLAGHRSLVYSDYGIVHPEFTDVGPNKNANAKIRYTTSGRIMVHRGHALAEEPKYQQYHHLAEQVRNSAEYEKSDFSAGDKYIDECADFNVGPGNLGTWVFVDMNHHLEFATTQMTSLAATVDATFSTGEMDQVMEAA